MNGNEWHILKIAEAEAIKYFVSLSCEFSLITKHMMMKAVIIYFDSIKHIRLNTCMSCIPAASVRLRTERTECREGFRKRFIVRSRKDSCRGEDGGTSGGGGSRDSDGDFTLP